MVMNIHLILMFMIIIMILITSVFIHQFLVLDIINLSSMKHR